MGEIIRTWMRTRLGVIIDLSPEIFGHYARDGTLLAKLLHSYDIINDSQLSTLNHTQDPALARVNLKNLRIWLRFIGVDCDDDCIDEISNGKGTTSLRLFYKVFLCLENKDSLHFITLQKEREKYIPNSSKFDVTTVSEEPEPWAPDDHPLSVPLKKNANLIDWHKKKYRELIEGCKKEKKKFRASQERDEILKESSAKEKTAPKKSTKALLEEEEKKELDKFADKHKIKKPTELLDSCIDIRRSTFGGIKTPKIDQEAAKAYTKSLKHKHRQEAVTKNFKSRIQKTFLSELWEQVLSDQEMELDEMVARKVLNQSQYEKQLMRKLCDIRSEKSRMAGNRRIVEELLQSTRESEERLEQDRAIEVLVRESEEIEAESRRMKELERRINEEVARKKKLKLRRIGEEVVADLVDMSLKVAEYRDSGDIDVPKSLWNQWKALFIKSQPIVEAPDSAELLNIDEFDSNGEEEGEQDSDNEMDENIDPARNNVLNDADFENYHHLRSPWNDFIPEIDIETREFLNLGLVVVGYIVHKILGKLYPRSEEPLEPPLPKMKIRAVVLGIPDSLLYEPIEELLQHSRIHLIRMEEAINHCLQQYKNEMNDVEYIDLNIIAATKESVNQQSPVFTNESVKKERKKLNKSASSGGKTESSIQRVDQMRVDKLTQTPRVIPYEDMDPSLTDTAYIGKWTHEFLTLGTPLSDELNSRILVEYLKSLKDIDGFVLVNYPNNYQQMASLEFALTGRKLPDNDDKYATEKEEINIEDIDPIPSRISFESEIYDSMDKWRRSRLVPNPIERIEASNDNSYMTAFIRMKPKPEASQLEDNQSFEILGEDATSLDAFYVEQDIASILYYKIFDLATLKRLVRLVLTGEEEYLTRASSSELFGEAMENYAGRRGDYSSGSKAPIVKKLLSRTSDYSMHESGVSEWTERSYEKEDNTVESIVQLYSRSKDSPPRPGDSDWSWANFPQASQLVEGLANLWQNLETSYIENLKDTFYLKRTNFEAIVPYANFVAKHMEEYIERPDKKQDLLHEFHRDFNAVDEEIRENIEMKNELHCRIADFQTRLWEICNLRRREAEDERKRIIMDHWTTQESMILANVYISIIQAEIDRYTDTLQIIQDYYLSMLQRPLQDIRRSRIILQKIPFEDSTSVSMEEIAANEKPSSKSLKDKDVKETKTKISNAKITLPPSPVEEKLFKEEMAKLLTEFDEEAVLPVSTNASKTIEANIRYVQTIVESIASSVLDILKKEETSSGKSPPEFKEKKGSSRKISESSRAEQEASRKRLKDLILEWRYAVLFEINRIRVRLKILEAAAKADVNFLVDKMQRVFYGIHERIIQRFKREVKSVDQMASTFCFAIEEATPIREEMLLDGDRFLVRSNVLMFPDKPQPRPSAIKEENLPLKFQIMQLGRLVDIFHRVAPTGILPERSFVYILQDLVACGDEEHEIAPLPSSWNELRACDVPKIVKELFGDIQSVDWREFIVYAMEIELPSVDELLDTLEAFRKIDKNSTDVISCEEFQSIRLWFFEGISNTAVSKSSMLHEDFEQEDEEIIEKYDYEDDLIEDSQENDMKPEEVLRLTLAKELLRDMFLSKPQIVNYVALLLVFCKDENPKIGFGKALSLATGNKICVDYEEGERYVRERLEKRIRASEARAYRASLREEATKTSQSILKSILEKVFNSGRAQFIEGISSPNKNYRKAPIRIEKLDEPGVSVDPVDLLPLEATPVSLSIDETEKSQVQEEIKNFQRRVIMDLPEGSEKQESSQDRKIRKSVYWLSIDVCQSVLAATLPRFVTNPDLFETGKSLRANLEEVYADLRIDELNVENGVVLAHRFFEHNFVKKLLAATTRFTKMNLSDVLKKILRSSR